MTRTRFHMANGRPGGTLLLIAAFAAGPALSAQTEAPTLVNNSPFVPADFQPPEDRTARPARPARQQSPQLEFRGVYSLGDTYHFNIFNRAENKGTWVTMNDPNAPYRVTEYDRRSDTVSLDMAGEPIQVAMHRPEWQPTPVEGIAAPSTDARTAEAREAAEERPPRRRVVAPPSREAIRAARERWERTPEGQRPPTPPPDFIPPPPPNIEPPQRPPGFTPGSVPDLPEGVEQPRRGS